MVALNGFGLRVPRMRSETTARIPANRLRLSGYCDTIESDIVRRQVRQIVQSWLNLVISCRESRHRYSAEAAYKRTDLFERRRRLMNDWVAYLAGENH